MLLFSSVTLSQFYSPDIYSPEKGLPSRFVYDVTQDSTGYIWISSRYGISCYDGFTFTNYQFLYSTRIIEYRYAINDEKNILWLIPRYLSDSIRVFSNNTWTTIPPPHNDESVLYLSSAANVNYENGNPVLAVGNATGLFIYQNNKWTFYSTNDGLAGKSIYNIASHNNSFYITTSNGISVYKSGSFDNSFYNSIKKDFPKPLNIFFKSSPDSASNKIYILDLNKLGYIENNKTHILTSDFQINFSRDVEAFPLAVDFAGNVFFGSLWGKFVYKIKSGTVQKLYKSNGFASDGCMETFIDKEHNIWFSDTRGLNKLKTIAFLNFNSASGLLEDEVSAIAEFGNNNLIFGHNQGISFRKNGIITTVSFSKFPHFRNTASRVLDIYNDGNGSLWLASHFMGVAKSDYNGNITWLNSPDSIAFSSVNKGLNGELLFATNRGVYTFENNSFKIYFEPTVYIRKIFNFNDGFLYFASNYGLFIHSKNSTKFLTIHNNIYASNIYAVYKDAKFGLLIGTRSGLYTTSGDSLVPFTYNGFSISDEVFAINKDSSGNLWFGTDKNLIKWDGNSASKAYDSNSGLIPGEINRSSLIIDSKQKIWIGTELGVSSFNQMYDYFKNFVPIPLFNGIFLNGNNFIPSGNLSTNSKNPMNRLSPKSSKTSPSKNSNPFPNQSKNKLPRIHSLLFLIFTYYL